VVGGDESKTKNFERIVRRWTERKKGTLRGKKVQKRPAAAKWGRMRGTMREQTACEAGSNVVKVVNERGVELRSHELR